MTYTMQVKKENFGKGERKKLETMVNRAATAGKVAMGIATVWNVGRSVGSMLGLPLPKVPTKQLKAAQVLIKQLKDDLTATNDSSTQAAKQAEKAKTDDLDIGDIVACAEYLTQLEADSTVTKANAKGVLLLLPLPLPFSLPCPKRPLSSFAAIVPPPPTSSAPLPCILTLALNVDFGYVCVFHRRENIILEKCPAFSARSIGSRPRHVCQH